MANSEQLSSTPLEENIDEENPDLETPIGSPAEIEQEVNPFDKKKRKKTSPVWEEFKEVKSPNGTTRYECIHCKTRLAKMKSGATTNFIRHLKGCTLRQIKLKGQKQLCVTTTAGISESVNTVENLVYDFSKVREAFSHMIVGHEIPFNFAEYELFHYFMKTNTPNWEKISRNTLRDDCFSTYELHKKKIRDLLSSANRVSITTDLWTSGQNIGYMVVNCHFVDYTLRLQKRILNFIDVPSPHTGIVLSDVLYKCLVAWGIEKKIWTITVDNASNNDACVNYLKQTLKFVDSLPFDGKFFHVRCCAHILNILMQDGMSEIGETIKNVRASVKYIGSAVSRLQLFGETVSQLKKPKRKLILDVSTRWSATYAMLVVALGYKDVFSRYAQRDVAYHTLPSENDWEKARYVCDFLEEFEVVTNVISGTDYPTSNLFLPELYHIKKVLDDATLSENSCMVGMALRMKIKFDKYWGKCNLLISLAAIMDPRNKIRFIEFAFGKVYSSVDAMKHMNEVIENLHSLFEEYISSYKAKIMENQSQNESQSQSSTLRLGKGRSRGRAQFDSHMRDVETLPTEKSELAVYLEERNHVHNDEIDPPFDALSWWRDQSLKFPILSIMACNILSIPITTVASESAFSAGGRVISNHRASLGTDTVEMLMCSSDWVRAGLGIT
ncbi:zinc finger BED domain-containing protein RICESLEEPER 2-like [Euphorbia lathyris]|uniref:zinc finger BED domain-containing protein RICESLEEPER 2-like n=1 Tax=Euphorbia lathyris TaxID=212925 RepID=UPI0033144B16